MKKVKAALGMILMLLPLLISVIHIYKPITYELHMKLFDALSGFYYFFSFFGGIYYAILSLIFFRKKPAFIIGLCGLLLYNAAGLFTYFSCSEVDTLGSAIGGILAGYHILTFLFCFDVLRLAKVIKQRRNKEVSDESITGGETKKRRMLLKYGLSIFMLVWCGLIALINVATTENVWFSIMYIVLIIGYVIPIIHPFFLVALSYKDKKGCFFRPFLEMCLLLIPYFLFLVVPLSFELRTICIVIAYEYLLTGFLWFVLSLVGSHKK